MRLTLGVLLALLISFYQSAAQHPWFVGLDSGSGIFSCDPVNVPYFQSDAGSLNGQSGIRSRDYKFFVGLKFETRSQNDKFTLLFGVRLTETLSVLDKKSNPGYFYYSTSEDSRYGVVTYYNIRVNSIKERSIYIGLPLELRYFPVNLKRLRPYVVIGAESGINLKTQIDIQSDDPQMGSHGSDAHERMRSPGMAPLFAAFYGGAGLRFGKVNKPVFSVELIAPSVLTPHSSDLVDTHFFGLGIHTQLQIPLNYRRIQTMSN